MSVDSSFGRAAGGRASEPELAMRPKVKPRQSHVKKESLLWFRPTFWVKARENHGAPQLFSREPSCISLSHQRPHTLWHHEVGLLT